MLLAELANRIIQIWNVQFSKVCFWSDSKITLAWIKNNAQWKTFVANRVAEIRRLTDPSNWYHVKSKENPADLISRGVNPQLLKNSSLWWHGPNWLTSCNTSRYEISELDVDVTTIPEQKPNTVSLKTTVQVDIFNRYSNINKLINVITYCHRFYHNCRNKIKRIGKLTSLERKESLNSLIRLGQNQAFSNEIRSLKANKSVDSSSNLMTLSPFVDDFGILRVGGRLKNANIQYDKKHQMILPKNHPLTTMIARNEHVVQLHCGPQQLLFLLRQKYWPIAGKNLVRKLTHNCMTCYRLKPIPYTQIMGNLPAKRINPSPPFYHTGIDYAGPFLTRDRRSRGYKTYKSYICLFICFSTKAVHLEPVSDLNTESFLATLRRFISRRGKPKTIFSDNGTNFVGANNEIKRLYSLINKNIHAIKNQLSKDSEEIEWHFIPPKSPHFGGLWESNVKLTKSHLTRVMEKTIFTFEELSTLLCQIEAVINSRPLCPMSNDPHDSTPLTPSHFLIGRPMVAAPDENVADTPDNKLSAFQRMQKLVQHFWKRWALEYLHELQTKQKWNKVPSKVPQEGDLVIIMERNETPAQWKLGRIVKLWPGTDNCIRVVSVKLANNFIVKRSVTKLCPAPTEE